MKALTKAYVNKEVAERTASDEAIMAEINKRLEGVDKFFETKMKNELDIIQVKLDEAKEFAEQERQAQEKWKFEQAEIAKEQERIQQELLEKFKENVKD